MHTKINETNPLLPINSCGIMKSLACKALLLIIKAVNLKMAIHFNFNTFHFFCQLEHNIMFCIFINFSFKFCMNYFWTMLASLLLSRHHKTAVSTYIHVTWNVTKWRDTWPGDVTRDQVTWHVTKWSDKLPHIWAASALQCLRALEVHVLLLQLGVGNPLKAF